MLVTSRGNGFVELGISWNVWSVVSTYYEGNYRNADMWKVVVDQVYPLFFFVGNVFGHWK